MSFKQFLKTQPSNYDELTNEEFDYAHFDANYVEESVLDKEARMFGAVNKKPTVKKYRT